MRYVNVTRLRERATHRPYASRSSSGLGHRPFTAATRVRFPYGTPKLSITYKKSRFHRSSNKSPFTPRLFANARPNHLDNLSLRFAFLIAHRLYVCVHRDFERCMTQQFLNDFRVLAVSVQDGAERVAKCMPTDTLG